jgi:hypothetical protein
MGKRTNLNEFAEDLKSGMSDNKLMRKHKLRNKQAVHNRRFYCRKKGLIPVINKIEEKNTNVHVKSLPEFKTITFPDGFIIAVANSVNKKMIINEKQIVFYN